MTIMPILSLNCFATGRGASVTKATTTTNAITTTNARQQVNNKKDGKWSLFKKAVVATAVLAGGIIVIHKLDLENAIGKASRYVFDYLESGVKKIPDVVSKLRNSFLKPRSIKVHENVSCPNITADNSFWSWLLSMLPSKSESRDERCLNEIIESLKEAYNQNIDLFKDPNANYSLLFVRQ